MNPEDIIVMVLDGKVVRRMRQSRQIETFQGRFRPTAERLRKITEHGAALLESATEEQLGSFSE